MLLQIFLASVLTLNVGFGAPPLTESHTEASNIETTNINYDYKIENKISTSEKSQLTDGNERYLVNSLDGKQNLPYVTDNWSYQPFIEYSNVGPHSKSITRIAFGKAAVEALQKSKEPQHNSQNVLYLQPEIGKPVDNQLISVQPEQNLHYLPSDINNQQDIYVTQPSGSEQPHVQQPQGPNVLYYTQVPQVQQVQVPHQAENVVYITPQSNLFVPNYDGQGQLQTNYYQPNHMYLVTHVQPQPQPQEQVYHNEDDNKDKDYKETLTKNTLDDEHDKKEKDKEKEHKDKETKKEHDDDEHVLVESSTAKAIIEEYEKHYVKKNVDVKTDGESGTTQNPYPSATTPLSVTKPAPLSKQPIIVPDLDENNLEYDGDKHYSTTQSTIKTVKTSSTIYRATQPTIVVTARPLGTTFLAPITAGVQLQSVEAAKDSVVVEIQKSLPYYLGKFEFVQNYSPNPNKNDEIKQNVDLGASLLKYSIERLPNPEAFISEFNQSNQFLTQVHYRTVHDQAQESDQHEYKIQQAPYQQILVQNPQLEITKLEKSKGYEVNDNSEEVPKVFTFHHQPQLQQQPLEQEPAQVQHQPIEQQYPPYQPVHQPQQQIVSVPIKTVADYIQRPQPHQQYQVPPIIQQKPITLNHQHQQGALLEPYPQVTKLIPQYVPLKFHHQEVQKAPMKSYSYAPSYQVHHHHNPYQPHQHNVQHNYQISHNHHQNKKQKNLATSYIPLGNNYYNTLRFNDYIGMKPPNGPINGPPKGGPPFKASQQLQTVHEYLPSTQLTQQQVRKYRNPRHSFGSNIRLEYGFMPPLIPSIEIDENGKPIEKTDH